MNKILSRIAALTLGLGLAIGVGVFANQKEAVEAKADTDVTFKIGTDSSSTSTMSKDGITLSTTNGTFSRTDNYRIYASNSLTVSSTVGNITKMVFTISQNTFTADVGTWTDASKTWTGSAVSITLTVSGGQVRFTQLVVTYANSGATYTIHYNNNGGSGSMDDSTGATPLVAACTFNAPEGKVFSRWNTAANGSGTDYAVGATAASDLTLYAIWENAPSAVSLNNIGNGLGDSANTVMATTNVNDDYTSAPYTLNYYQCKLQTSGDIKGIFLTKSVNAFVSNHTEMPRGITSVELFVSPSAAAATTYDVAFGDSEFTSATSGIGAVNIAAGNSHEFVNSSNVGAKYFCISLGNANNGQIYKIVINYEAFDPSLDNMTIKLNQSSEGPFNINYSSSAYSFYANDTGQVDADWTVGDNTIITVEEDANHVALVRTLKPGTTTLTATADGHNPSTVQITVNAGTVQSLAITGSMTKKDYSAGESWNPAGFVVNATYSTGYVANVTNQAEWSYNPASPALGVESVVATASFGGQNVSSSAQAVTVTRINPIQGLYSKASGAAVDVYGYYVGFLDGTGPVIMDGEYGIVIYAKTHDVSSYEEGKTILHVTGSISIYNGLYEIAGTVNIQKVASADVAAPVTYAAKGGETNDYASRLTTVTGKISAVTQGSLTADPAAADIKMTFTVGAASVQVFYKKAAQDATDMAKLKAAMDADEEITIKGFTSWYNAFQVQMSGIVAADESYTAAKFAQDLLDDTKDLCDAYVDGTSSYSSYRSQLQSIWSSLASKYATLPNDEKTTLGNALRNESGTVVEQAMARYDFLTGKYELSNFIVGRTPISNTLVHFDILNGESNTVITVIVLAASISMVGTALFFILKKKRESK